MPVLPRVRGEGLCLAQVTGVVDQNVRRAFVRQPCQGSRNGTGVRDIDDVARRARHLRGIRVPDADGRSTGQKRLSDRFADSLGTTGDDGGFSPEVVNVGHAGLLVVR